MEKISWFHRYLLFSLSLSLSDFFSVAHCYWILETFPTFHWASFKNDKHIFLASLLPKPHSTAQHNTHHFFSFSSSESYKTKNELCIYSVWESWECLVDRSCCDYSVRVFSRSKSTQDASDYSKYGTYGRHVTTILTFSPYTPSLKYLCVLAFVDSLLLSHCNSLYIYILFFCQLLLAIALSHENVSYGLVCWAAWATLLFVFFMPLAIVVHISMGTKEEKNNNMKKKQLFFNPSDGR